MPSPAPAPNVPSATVLDAHDLARTVDRIAHQIIERTAKSDAAAALVGIPTRGVPLARRLADRIRAFDGPDISIGSLDTTLYRDDLRLHGVRPLAETIEPRGGITGRLVILVDDVLFSGRTIRAALDAIRDLGRPSAVQLAVLIDRGHRQLPIRADYVGKNLPTSVDQNVRVMLSEIDGSDAVLLTGPVGQGGDSE